MKFSILLLLLAATAAHSRHLLDVNDDCEQGEDCHGPRSPKFKVIGHQGESEIREYANATWAVSFGRSRFGIDVAAVIAAKGLVGYFAGENNEHRRLGASVPLINTVLPPHPPHPHPPHGPGHHNGSHPHHPHGPGDHNSSHPPHNGSHPHPPHPPHPHPPGPPPPRGPLVLAAAFVSKRAKDKVPQPDAPFVKLVHTNSSKVYSHRFGGFAISWFIKREIKHLKVDLKAAGEKPCKGRFFVAIYDGPFKVFGRKNEILWTKRHHHHHNHSDDASSPEMMPFEDSAPQDFESRDFKMPELTGFDQMDPMYLFPEEMEHPEPLPEGAPELKEASIEELPTLDDFIDAGEWTSESGRSIPDEQIQLSFRD